MAEDILILVDKHDREIGFMGKLEAHQKGLLHRAFSVLIFNNQGQLMIHQRAAEKYHSASLWTNTCCGHPRKGEDTLSAAKRRLQEEMGFSTPLEKVFSFMYQAEFENNLKENELDHVFIGYFNDTPAPNRFEVSDWCFVSLEQLNEDIMLHPEKYTVWFKHILHEQDTIAQHLKFQSV